MSGWLSEASSLRLALEAREALGVGGEGLGQALIATSRPSFVSVARYTSPMPPAPMRGGDAVVGERLADQVGSSGRGGRRWVRG